MWVSLNSCLQHAAGHGVELFEELGVAFFRRGDDCGIQHMLNAERRRRALRPKFAHDPLQQGPSFVGISRQHPDHLFHRDVVVARVPAIVIGHHGDDRIRQLRLARQFGFRHRGHADDVAFPGAIKV